MRRLIVLLSACALSSCASTPRLPPENFVQQQWVEGVQRLGQALTPVYPPSEDYQVGDIYAVGMFSFEHDLTEIQAKTLPRTVRIASSDASVALYTHYAKRFRFPPSQGTSETLSTSTPFGKSGSKAIEYDCNPAGQPPCREKHPGLVSPAQIVAFPEFTIAAGSLDQFGASFATSAFGLVFGGASSKDVALHIKIPAGETYGLDALEADRQFTAFCKADSRACDEKTATRLLNQSVAALGPVHALTPPGQDPFEKASLYYIQRIYMTREIHYEYTFNSTSAFVAAANAAAASGEAEAAKAELSAVGSILQATKPAATGSSGSGASSAGSNSPGNTSIVAAGFDAASALASDVATRLNGLSGVAGQSAFYTTRSFTKNSITLSQVFARPVVFAFNGLYRCEREPCSVPVVTTAVLTSTKFRMDKKQLQEFFQSQ